VLGGEARARDNADRVELVRHCDLYGWDAGGAKLYAEALEADPNMPPVRGESPAWIAARYAARAGTGMSSGGSPLDVDARARLRRQALAWMRAELNTWPRRPSPDKPEMLRRAADFLDRYMTDPALFGVRDREALERLPAEERQAWEQLWKDARGHARAKPDR
jgi:hypothetical protein